jgi:hypothetical protein
VLVVDDEPVVDKDGGDLGHLHQTSEKEKKILLSNPDRMSRFLKGKT